MECLPFSDLKIFLLSIPLCEWLTSTPFLLVVYYIYIYIFDKYFNNRYYFFTLEVTLIRTVDIGDNKYYLTNIMEKVIPKSKTKFLQIYIYKK